MVDWNMHIALGLDRGLAFGAETQVAGWLSDA